MHRKAPSRSEAWAEYFSASPEIRIARRLEHQANRLQYEALVSGAMPSEFRVVHVYKSWPQRGLATELR